MTDLELIAECIREQHGTDVTADDLHEIQMFLWEKSQDRQLGLIKAGEPDYDAAINADIGKVIGFVVGAVLGAFLLPGLGIVAGWVTGALVGGAIGVKLASVFDGPAKLEPSKAPVKSTTDPVFNFSGVGGLVSLNAPIPKIYGNRYENPAGGIKFRDPPRIYTRMYSRKGTRYLESISVLAFGRLGEINWSGLELDDKPRSDFFLEDFTSWNSEGLPFQDQPPDLSLPWNFSQAVAASTNVYVGIYPALTFEASPAPTPSPTPTPTPTPATDTGLVATSPEIRTNLTIAPVEGGTPQPYISNTSTEWGAGGLSPSFTAGGPAGSYIYVSAFFRTSDPTGSGQNQIYYSVSPRLAGAVGIATGSNATIGSAAFSVEFYSKSYLYSTRTNTISPSDSIQGWCLKANGVIIAQGNAIVSGDSNSLAMRVVRQASGVTIELILNGSTIHTAASSEPYPANARAGFYARFINTSMSSLAYQVFTAGSTPTPTPSPTPAPTPTPQGYSDLFTVSAKSFSRLSAGQIYRGDGTGDLFVVSSDAANRNVRFSRPFSLAPLDRVYRAHITTSKKVTRIDITIEAQISAKDDRGELVPHAEAFSLSITPLANAGIRSASGVQLPPEGAYRCGHFAIKSSSETRAIHTVSIDNLPYDFYQVTLCPLKSSQLIAPVRYLTIQDAEGLLASSPEQAIIGGKQIVVRAEVTDASITELQSLMSLDGKIQVSAESGPTIRVTHLNEIVDANLNGKIEKARYNGYTVGYTRTIASDRIQSAATETWDVVKGAIVPNYIFYSKTAIIPNDRNDLVGFATALPDGLVQRGDRIRVLGVGTRVITDLASPARFDLVWCFLRQITIQIQIGSPVITIPNIDEYNWALEGMPIKCPSLPADSFLIRKLNNNRYLIGSEFDELRVATATGTILATINEQLLQTSGEEAVIYRMDASNYFPDLYVDRLINRIDGLGNLVDRDRFIHYQSIVEARKFCVRNRFYFDGVVGEGSFEQWATTAAPSSLLFCTEIEGRYALIPQETTPNKAFLFTDANTIQYSEPGVPWHQQVTNTILVKYQDNLGREKQVKICTQAVADRIEIEIPQTINAQGVTRIEQAIRVGQVSLKSLMLQTKTCQIITDINNGLYCIQGDIIRTQHAEIQFDKERQGLIMSARNYGNLTRSIVQTVAIDNINNGFLNASESLNVRLDGNGLIREDLEISESAPNNGNYPGANCLYISDRTVYVPTGSSANTAGGVLRIHRYFNSQEIKLSEAVTIDSNSRITVCHRQSRLTELDKSIVSIGDGWYRVSGLEESLSPGDAFAIAQVGSIIRYWRVVSVQPDYSNNKVTLAGVLWDDSILDPAGLVTI